MMDLFMATLAVAVDAVSICAAVQDALCCALSWCVTDSHALGFLPCL